MTGDTETEAGAPGESGRAHPGLPEPVFGALEFERLPLAEMRLRAAAGYAELDRRRTTRDFSLRARVV